MPKGQFNLDYEETILLRGKLSKARKALNIIIALINVFIRGRRDIAQRDINELKHIELVAKEGKED